MCIPTDGHNTDDSFGSRDLQRNESYIKGNQGKSGGAERRSESTHRLGPGLKEVESKGGLAVREESGEMSQKVVAKTLLLGEWVQELPKVGRLGSPTKRRE